MVKKKVEEKLIKTLFFIIPLCNKYIISNFKVLKLVIALTLLLIFLFEIKNIISVKLNKRYIKLLFSLFLFDIYILIMEIFKGEYIKIGHFYAWNLSMIFLFLGYILKNKIILKNYLKSYIYGTSIMALVLYFKYYYAGIDYSKTQYLIGQKNSLGIFLVLSILSCEFLIYLNKKNWKKYIFLLFNFYVLVLIRNRTGIIFSVIATLYFILKTNKLKNLINRFIMSLFFVLIFFYSKIKELLEWSMGFTHKIIGESRLETLSSGRISWFKESIKIFKNNYIFGIGDYYVDNLYLNFLTGLGIIGFLILFIFIYNYIKIIMINNKMRGEELYINSILIYGLLCSFLESLLPFGPGMSIFLLWFLLGYTLKNS